MFITLFLVSLLFLCGIILFSYQYRPPDTLSRFEHYKQLYNKCLSGSYKDIDKCEKVVTKLDEVLLFGKMFYRPHPPMRPLLKTVFHDNNYDDWMRTRKTLVRNILAPRITKSLEPLMSLCASEVLETKSPAVVEVVQLVRRYMNKVMYRCVFGGDGVREREEEFIHMSSKLRHEESEALVKGMDLSVDIEDTEAETYFKKLIWGPNRSDEESFLSKLKVAFSSTPDDVESNSISFILGGFTSCVSALVFVLYELAARPDIQEALRMTPVPHSLFTRVIKEGLRKYPPFSAVIKTQHGNVSNRSWVLPVSGIHRDPEIYPEPSEFLPNREFPKHMFCAFGLGLRRCPGEHFSYSAVDVFLKQIVRNFKISRKPTCDHGQEELGFSKGKFTTTVDSLELLFEGL